jgi:hypothetical protein
MIIDNLNIRRPWLLVQPFEADSPLIINPNAVLSPATSGQSLEAIPRQRGEIPE